MSRLRFYLATFLITCGLLSGSIFSVSGARAATLSDLHGYILLQVQDRGQAWYVNPTDGQRYYLGRPDDAFNLMRRFGLGISNSDFSSLEKTPRRSLAGRILLKVEDSGRAYYLDPRDFKLYYLGRPAEAFNIIRSRGLGITNADLASIPAAPSQIGSVASPNRTVRFTFKYQAASYELIKELSTARYESYKNSPKAYSYSVGYEPANLREAFYGMFLKIKEGDMAQAEILGRFRAIAKTNGWTDDQLAEFVLAFVQYIPYDSSKVLNGSLNTNPFYPYETLYLDIGVCSDKTFLAVSLLRQLGYGAAILDFPDINHTAVGIACPAEYSLSGSGYCYVETTNYFPPGVIPQTINSGQAEVSDNKFSDLFNPSSLGKIEILQATTGQTYQGMAALRAKVDSLKVSQDSLKTKKAELETLDSAISIQETDIDKLQAQMDDYYNGGRISEYNSLVPAYNSLADKYNSDLAVYRQKVEQYNQEVAAFNQAAKDFYQQ